MSVLDTLITDRTQADVTRWKTLHDKGWSRMSPEEKVEWSSGLKGTYNATDLNRVTAAMEELDQQFRQYGYSTGYQRIEIPHIVHTDIFFEVSLAVDPSTTGSWKFALNKSTVSYGSDNILIIASHSTWDSGIRYIHFSVVGASGMAEGGTSGMSGALTPEDLSASFTIHLAGIVGPVKVTITNVTG